MVFGFDFGKYGGILHFPCFSFYLELNLALGLFASIFQGVLRDQNVETAQRVWKPCEELEC